jgi:histidine triad (HIT) family protein
VGTRSRRRGFSLPEDCIFCTLYREGEHVAETEGFVAIRDIAPKAPTHILLIPRRHIASALDLAEADGPLLGRLFGVAAELARSEGIADAGYRLASNVGSWGGQSVDHLHVHLMGGRPFTWPPG